MTSHRSIQLFVSTLCLSLSPWALAASIHFDQTSTTGLSIGERFTLEILADNFIDGRGTETTADDQAGTFGGGLELKWDPTVLTINDLADIELLFPGDHTFNFDKGILDAGAGVLRNLSVANAIPLSLASFSIAKITFTTLSEGISHIILDTGTFAAGGLNVWSTFEGFDEIPGLTYGNATATVAAPIPLPAPLLLLPSALSFLAFRKRSRPGSTLRDH
jgi:hypothetical protein